MRPGRRWVGITLALIAVLLTVAGLVGYLLYPALRTPPRPKFPPPTSLAEAQRQDLAYLKTTLHSLDRSFSADEQRVFDSRIDELSRRAGEMDAPAFEMGLSRAVAAADNGHTNLLGAVRGLTLNSVPLRLYWFSDGLRVVATDPAHSDLLGAEVLSLAGRTPEAIIPTVEAYVGGTASLARELSPYVMASPQALQAIGVQTSPTSVELTLRTLDGRTVRRSLAAGPVPAAGPAPPRTARNLLFDARELHWPRRALSPSPLPGQAAYPQPSADGRPRAHVLDGKEVALTLREPNRFYWSTRLADGEVLFIQLNAMLDQPGQEPLHAFLEDTLSAARAKPPRFAIVDLRWNPGGSYQHAADFARELPAVLAGEGRLFILTSGSTFSAAIVTAARLKHFAGDRAMIVGEPMGDRPQFWAEAAGRVVLPNSGLRVGYAAGYHDWENGCSLRDLLFCYPPNYILGVAAGDLSPKIAARGRSLTT